MQEEIWKSIPNYKNYLVSNNGFVINVTTNKILVRSLNNGGYLHVCLYNKGIKKTILIHKLVAVAFLNHNPCGHKIIIDHINGDKLDNRVENLQLITQRENVSKANVTSKSIYKGVSWNIGANKWISQIHYLGKRLHLGLFECEFQAHLAYQNKLKELNNE